MSDSGIAARSAGVVKSRPLLWFSIAFSFSALCVMLCFSAGIWLGVILSVVAGLLIAAAMLALPRFRVWIIPVGIIVGAVWCAVFIWLKYLPATRVDGLTDYINFTCDSFASGYGSYGMVDGRITSISGKAVNLSARLYLNDGSPGLEPGDTISLAVSIKLVERGAANWHIASGRYIIASQKSSITYGQAHGFSLRHWGARTAKAIGDKIAAMLDGDEAGLLIALLTGDRSRYSRDFNAALMNSGTSHITAVSGMHITILVGILVALLGRKRAMYVALPVVVLFSAICGFAPSIMRAAIMCAVSVLAFALRRENDTLTSLFVALLALVVVNPFSITSPSLTLSFVSTLGIMLFSPMINRGLRRLLPASRGRAATFLDKLCSTTAASIAPMAITLPLCALYFARVSLISALTTELVLPALIAVMAIGIPVAVLSAFWTASAKFFAVYLLRWPLRLMLGIITWLGGKNWVASSASVYFALAIIALATVMIALRAKKLSGAVSFAIAAAAFCTFFAFTAFETRVYSEISISGTGGSAIVLIRSGNSAMAVNMGGINRGRSAAFVDDTLAGWGIAYLEKVVLTSGGYRDTGGLEQALERVSAGQIYLPEGEFVRGANAETDILWYSEPGAVSFGGFTIELFEADGGRFIPRITSPGVSIINVCGVTPITALAALYTAPQTDILLVDKNYAANPVSFEKLCLALGVHTVAVCEDEYTGLGGFENVFSGAVLRADEIRIKMLAK